MRSCGFLAYVQYKITKTITLVIDGAVLALFYSSHGLKRSQENPGPHLNRLRPPCHIIQWISSNNRHAIKVLPTS